MSNADSQPSPTAQTAATPDSATYTVEQLAALLQCSPRHIWRMCDLNRIPGRIRFGRLVRFSRVVVDAWLLGEKGGDR
jgi:excisionase family DNA binding protein